MLLLHFLSPPWSTRVSFPVLVITCDHEKANTCDEAMKQKISESLVEITVRGWHVADTGVKPLGTKHSRGLTISALINQHARL